MILLVASPVLSRLYSPDSFGHLALAMAVASVSATLITLRYETAIQLPKSDGEAKSLIMLSILVGLCGSVLLCLAAVIYTSAAPINAPLRSLGDWLIAAVLSGFAVAVIATATYWFNRTLQYRTTALVKIFQAVALVCIAFALASVDYAEGLVLAYVSAMALTFVLCLYYIAKELKRWNSMELAAIARRFSSTPKYLLAANLIDVLTSQVPVVLIALWFNDSFAGQFGLAWRVLAAPMAVIGVAVGQVFYQRAASMWPDAVGTKRLLHQAWKGLGIVGFLPMLVVFGTGPRLFSLVFGNDWREAGELASVLSIMVFGLFLASPTSTIFLVMGLHRWMPVFSAAQLIYRPLAIYIGSVQGNLVTGLWIWVVCETVVMVSYHSLAYRKLSHYSQTAH